MWILDRYVSDADDDGEKDSLRVLLHQHYMPFQQNGKPPWDGNWVRRFSSELAFHPSSILYITDPEDLRLLTPETVPYHLWLGFAENPHYLIDHLEALLSHKVRALRFDIHNASIWKLIAYSLPPETKLRYVMCSQAIYHYFFMTPLNEIIGIISTALNKLDGLVFELLDDSEFLDEFNFHLMTKHCLGFVNCKLHSSSLIMHSLLDTIIDPNCEIAHFSLLGSKIAQSESDGCVIANLFFPTWVPETRMREFIFPDNFIDRSCLKIIQSSPGLEYLDFFPFIIRSKQDMNEVIMSTLSRSQIRSLKLNIQPLSKEDSKEIFNRLLSAINEHQSLQGLRELSLAVPSGFVPDIGKVVGQINSHYLPKNIILTPCNKKEASYFDLKDFYEYIQKPSVRPFGLEIWLKRIKKPSVLPFGLEILLNHKAGIYDDDDDDDWRIAMALSNNRTFCHFVCDLRNHQAKSSIAIILQKNRCRLNSMNELQKLNKNDLLESPRTAKLFLCGHGEVGKTTIRRALLNRKRRRKHFVNLYNKHFEPRTKGMELHTLKFPSESYQNQVNLVICDLAGQHVYHAFHHFFFSDSNRSLFMIVCKWTSSMSQSHFDAQLEYWLRFIVSHRSSTALDSKPKVVVLVNFFGFDGTFSSLSEITKDLTQKLINKYRDVLDFGDTKHMSEQEALGVIATKYNSYLDILYEKLESLINNMLIHMPEIPRACRILSKVIAQLNPQKTKFMIYRDLLEAFSKEIKFIKNVDKTYLCDIFNVAMNQLHNQGQIVYFPTKPPLVIVEDETSHLGQDHNKAMDHFVIIDPNWFCNELVGTLLSSKELDGVACHKKKIKETGTIHINDLKQLLAHLNPKHHSWASNILNAILWYLQNLELCYRNIGGIGYEEVLFPALLREDTMSWSSVVAINGTAFYGRRLKCRDTEKHLIPYGIFTRLQVVLQEDKKRECYKAWHCHSSFIQDGVKVVVRFGASEDSSLLQDDKWSSWKDYNSIDILLIELKDSKCNHVDRLLSELKQTIYEVCQGVKDFRAIPTVQLSEYALKGRDINTYFRCINDIRNAIYTNGLEATLCWKHGPKSSHVNEIFVATNYLLPSEVDLIVTNEISEIAVEFGVRIDQNPLTEGGEEFGMNADQYSDGNTLMLKEIKTDIKSLYKILEKIQCDIINQCSFGMVQELLEGPLPCYPYLKDHDSGQIQRLKNIVTPGKRTYLHFLCEACVSGSFPHPIEDQKGIEIVIKNPEWSQKLSPVLVPALQILCCAGKIATNSALPGLDRLIPTSQKVLTLLGFDKATLQEVMAPELLKMYLSDATNNVANTPNFLRPEYQLQKEQLMECLVQILSTGHDIDMARDFKLRRVKLRSDSRSQRVAWLCEEHARGHKPLPNCKNPFIQGVCQ